MSKWLGWLGVREHSKCHEFLLPEVASSGLLFRLNFCVNPLALVTKTPGAKALGIFCTQVILRLVRKASPVFSAYAFVPSASPSIPTGASFSSTDTPISTFGFSMGISGTDSPRLRRDVLLNNLSTVRDILDRRPAIVCIRVTWLSSSASCSGLFADSVISLDSVSTLWDCG